MYYVSENIKLTRQKMRFLFTKRLFHKTKITNRSYQLTKSLEPSISRVIDKKYFILISGNQSRVRDGPEY